MKRSINILATLLFFAFFAQAQEAVRELDSVLKLIEGNQPAEDRRQSACRGRPRVCGLEESRCPLARHGGIH